MSTDDAYVEADKVGISTDVAGIVKEVDVQGEPAGRRPARFSTASIRVQFQIALDNAKANLAQTALSHRGDEAGLQAHAQRHRRTAGAGRSRSDQLRSRRDAAAQRHHLASRLRSGEIHARRPTRASSMRCASRRKCSSPGSAAMPDIDVTQHPQYLQAQAQVDEAQRQLDHTVVKAPFAGIVTDVPAIAPGKYLAASTTAFYLVDTDHVWVDANPERDRADLCAARAAGHGDGRHLSGRGMARHRREHQPGRGAGVLAAAGAEHQRQLGEGRAARSDARARRHRATKLCRRCAPG